MRIETVLAEETAFDPAKWKGSDADARALQKWLDSLNYTAGRTPRGAKQYVSDLQFIQKHLDHLLKPPPPGYVVSSWPAIQDNSREQIRRTLERWSAKDIAEIESKLKKKSGETDELRLKNATYTNRSNFSFTRFKKAAEEIDKFLGSLRGFHRKAVVAKPLKVILVKKSEIKAKAKYKGQDDIILIRPDALGSGDDYASLPYVTLHELGHRYEKFVGASPSFTDSSWKTTPYSETDSFAGNEAFAELFALSHWPQKYPQYKDTIDKFLERMGR